MKNLYIITLFLSIILSSCISFTKYNFDYKTGKSVNFSSGKYILNTPKTSFGKKDIYDLAYTEFKKILGDSLYGISQVRREKLLASKYPYDLSKRDLEELNTMTGYDYIINIKSYIRKNEVGMLKIDPAPELNSKNDDLRENVAYNEIRIYSLKTQTLVSETSVLGSVAENKDSKAYVNVMNGAGAILTKGLRKLIRKLKKYGW